MRQKSEGGTGFFFRVCVEKCEIQGAAGIEDRKTLDT